MKITSQEEYGLRCLVQIAKRGMDGNPTLPVPISEIAKAEGISVEYAGKLLSLLRQEKLVKSSRGKNGGYTLALPPEEISLLRLVNALSGQIFEQDSCNRFSGTGVECVHIGDCGMRPVWWALSNLIEGLLDSITVAGLCESEFHVGASLRDRLLAKIEQIAPLPRAASPHASGGPHAPAAPTTIPLAGIPLATPGLIPASKK